MVALAGASRGRETVEGALLLPTTGFDILARVGESCACIFADLDGGNGCADDDARFVETDDPETFPCSVFLGPGVRDATP